MPGPDFILQVVGVFMSLVGAWAVISNLDADWRTDSDERLIFAMGLVALAAGLIAYSIGGGWVAS